MEKKEKKQNIKKRENVKTKKEMGNSQILCMLKGIVMADRKSVV